MTLFDGRLLLHPPNIMSKLVDNAVGWQKALVTWTPHIPYFRHAAPMQIQQQVKRVSKNDLLHKPRTVTALWVSCWVPEAHNGSTWHQCTNHYHFCRITGQGADVSSVFVLHETSCCQLNPGFSSDRPTPPESGTPRKCCALTALIQVFHLTISKCPFHIN